jgi:glycine/D-amino acid oxidase-like deaminating enzyme
LSSANPNTFSPSGPAVKVGEKQVPSFAHGAHIAVVGSGAFGSWTALFLLEKGFKVSLIDPWGPGNSRSSSGDETRVIRSTYGANETYFDLNVKALSLWKDFERRLSRKIFYNTGVLWLCYDDATPLVDDSRLFARKHGMDYEYLSTDDLKERFPLIHASDLHHAYFDPFGGYLKARESVQLVVETFISTGGSFIQAAAAPGDVTNSEMSQLKLSNGEMLRADAYVFACGSWLSKIFESSLPGLIQCTKQEVYYFGVPADMAAQFDKLPVWVDVDGKDFYYGIPGNQMRGFKLGVDIRGKAFDPTSHDHVPDPDTLKKARTFIAHRFPGLANAPVVESRVCPYENSPDGNFVFDLLPGTKNAFILGGGSGHGFKHSPALGHHVAEVLSGAEPIKMDFLLR